VGVGRGDDGVVVVVASAVRGKAGGLNFFAPVGERQDLLRLLPPLRPPGERNRQSIQNGVPSKRRSSSRPARRHLGSVMSTDVTPYQPEVWFIVKPCAELIADPGQKRRCSNDIDSYPGILLSSGAAR